MHGLTLALRVAFVAAILFSNSLPARASSQAAPQKPKPNAAAEKPAKNEAIDPAEEQRRTTALLLLRSLADEARDFREASLRARVQMQAAESLWEHEPARARALFRRAWAAAVAGDRENERRRDENVQEQLRARGAAVHADIPNLKYEVLRAASRRDPALAGEFLKSLDDEKNRAEGDAPPREEDAAAPRRPTNLDANFEASDAFKQRLKLARDFLLTGDTARAVEFAAPALAHISKESISFLSFLRQTDAASADRHFSQLVARAAADPSADANTVSLLSSYVFKPGQFFLMFHNGGSTNQSGDIFPPPALAPNLRATFLRIAAQILLRPLAPPEQDRTTAGRLGTLRIAQALLPFFEQHAPGLAAQLNARIANLIDEIPDQRRREAERARLRALQGDASAVPPATTSTPRGEEGDEASVYIERANKLELSVQERDSARARAAMILSGRGDMRARELAERIEDRELRAQARDYVDFELGRGFRGDGAIERALEIAAGDGLTPVKRVWLMTEAARLLADEEPARAVGILEDAAGVARRIEVGDPDRPRALAAVAVRLHPLDRQRAWTLMSELVKSANSADAFTGQDAQLVIQIKAKGFSSMSDRNVPELDLAGLFTSLAAEDLGRATEFAREFSNEAPRAAATLAIARAVLERKDSAKKRAAVN